LTQHRIRTTGAARIEGLQDLDREDWPIGTDGWRAHRLLLATAVE